MLMKSGSELNPRKVLLLAGVILAPAVALAFLSFRSLSQEGAERRTQIQQWAAVSARNYVHELEAKLVAAQERAWREAGPLGPAAKAGGLFCLWAEDRSWIYPRRLDPEAPSLEERVRRENPQLAHPLAIASDLEFRQGRPHEAALGYAQLLEQVEAPSTRAALAHARARAALRSGHKDEARLLYERLSRESPEACAESGLPYSVLAAVRLAALDPDPGRLAELERRMAELALPGYVRVFLLKDLPAPEALRRARALEALEQAQGQNGDEIVRIDGQPFLLSLRPRSGLAIPLEPLGASRIVDGIALEAESLGSPIQPGELLARAASSEIPSLVVAARLADPERLRIPRSRLVVTGGWIVCLVAALFWGTFSLLRTVRRELALARMKSDFISGVSHDLKTPLTSIRMFAEMLEAQGAASPERVREYPALIHRESLRLSRLVENVLDFTRIEEGRKTFLLEPRSLKDVVLGAVETFRAQLGGPAIRLSVDVPDQAPQASVDRDALAGAILNLLDNAQKYGGDPREIRVQLAVKGQAAEISVRDNGPGIPPEEQGRIFEKFFRGRGAVSGPTGGAGLGLALVKSVVLAHQGSVTVKSELGKGSCFILKIPLCRESSS